MPGRPEIVALGIGSAVVNAIGHASQNLGGDPFVLLPPDNARNSAHDLDNSDEVILDVARMQLAQQQPFVQLFVLCYQLLNAVMLHDESLCSC